MQDKQEAERPLEDLSIDELDQISLGIKAQIEELRNRRRYIAAIRAHKANVINVAARLNVDVSDLTPEQVLAIASIKAKPRPGDVVVTPEPAVITVEGN